MINPLDKQLRTYTVDTLNVKDRFTVQAYYKIEAMSWGRYECNKRGVKYIGIVKTREKAA